MLIEALLRGHRTLQVRGLLGQPWCWPADPALEPAFDALWKEANISGIRGHRSVGGYRASMYNALPLESVQVLVDVMNEFAKKNG